MATTTTTKRKIKTSERAALRRLVEAAELCVVDDLVDLFLLAKAANRRPCDVSRSVGVLYSRGEWPYAYPLAAGPIKNATKAQRACDLCGEWTRYSRLAAEFDIEGRVCIPCLNEMKEEATLTRAGFVTPPTLPTPVLASEPTTTDQEPEVDEDAGDEDEPIQPAEVERIGHEVAEDRKQWAEWIQRENAAQMTLMTPPPVTPKIVAQLCLAEWQSARLGTLRLLAPQGVAS